MSDHEKVFEFFTEDVKTQAGAALRSVVVYGSSLTGDFRPGRSDYNFLVMVEPCDLDLLDRLAARMGKWRKRAISAPLLLLPEFIRTALDSYPLELLSIQSNYRLLHGEDPIRELAFEREHVRLQCEREIRSKLLLFRRAYLEAEGAPQRLQVVVARGLPSLSAIFRGLLWLQGGPWQASGEEFRRASEEGLRLPAGLLDGLVATRARRDAPSREEVRQQIGDVLAALTRLAREVDRW